MPSVITLPAAAAATFITLAGFAVATNLGDGNCSSTNSSTSSSTCSSTCSSASDSNQAAVQTVAMKSNAEASSARAPKLLVVAFHADWCGKCKVLGPKVMGDVAPAFGADVLFVKLDLTDKNSPQAEYMLAALGLADLWTEHAGKTGFALLVDPATKKAVGTLRADQSADDLKSAVKAAIKA